MHELSIANHIVEIASEYTRDENIDHVVAVTLRIGALTCVHPQALASCFDFVSKGTLLEQAQLRLIEVPVAIDCEHCKCEVELPGIQSIRCPRCQNLSQAIVRGRELEIESIEVMDKSELGIEPC